MPSADSRLLTFYRTCPLCFSSSPLSGLGYANRASQGNAHIFHCKQQGSPTPLLWLLIYRFGLTSTLWTSGSVAPLSTVWPHQVSVRRLTVLLHDFLHPWIITAIGLSFATLGCRYPWPDFHRQDVRHAWHTNKEHRITI